MLLGITSDNVYHHIYASNINGKVNGVAVDGKHIFQIDNAFKLFNSVSRCANGKDICPRGRMNKRDNSSSTCKFASGIYYNKEVNTYTINILKLFKDKKINSNILSHYNNLENIYLI